MTDEKMSTKQRVREEKAQKEEDLLKIAENAMKEVFKLNDGNAPASDMLNMATWVMSLTMRMVVSSNIDVSMTRLLDDLAVEAVNKYKFICNKEDMAMKAESEKKDVTADN